jgi:hypothetical protein
MQCDGQFLWWHPFWVNFQGSFGGFMIFLTYPAITHINPILLCTNQYAAQLAFQNQRLIFLRTLHSHRKNKDEEKTSLFHIFFSTAKNMT